MTLRHGIIFTAFYLLSCSLQGQTYRLDSLKQSLSNTIQTDSAEVLKELEKAYIFRGEFDNALKYALELLKLREKAKDSSKMAASLSNIGIIYSQLKDYQQSQNYYTQSLKIDSLIGNDIGVAAGLNNLGLLLADQKKYESALDYYNKSLKIKERISDSAGIAATLNNVGLLYEEGEEKYDLAIEYYQKALNIFEDLDDGWNIANSNNNIGIGYLMKKSFGQAEQYLQKAYQLAEKESALPLMLNNIGFQATLYEQKKDYAQAFKLKQQELVLYDSMFNEDKVQEITRIQEEYNAEIKDKQIKLLASEAKLNDARASRSFLLNILLLIAVFASLIIISLISRANRMRKKTALVLRRERDSIKQYLDLAEAVFLLLDWEGRIQMINVRGCEILEYSEDELLGENVFEKVMPEEQQEELEAYHQAVIAGRDQPHQQIEVEFLSKSGKHKHISWTESLVYNHEDRPFAILASASDITVILEAETREKLALINGQELERRRIAEDLHDGIGPMLSATKLQMGMFNEPHTDSSEVIKQTQKLLDQTIAEVRAISQNLSATRVQHLGLEKAMRDICDQINNTNTLSVSFQAFRIPTELPEMKALAIFRIFQELVNNVLIHAEAQQLNIQVLNHTDRILLMVEDNGKGFVYENVKTKGMGLNNIMARVRTLSGTCDLDSQLGRGCLVTVEIPI